MTVIIRDTFAGPLGNTIVAPLYRGNLYPQNKQGLIGPNDHVSDSGHVWYKGYWSADLQLSGDGRCWPDYPQNSNRADAFCLTPIEGRDYFVELDVNIPANDDSGWLMIFFKIDAEPHPDWGANGGHGSCEWFPVNGTSPEMVQFQSNGNSIFGYDAGVSLSAGVFGDHTFRIECRGNKASAFTDGIARHSITMNSPWWERERSWVGFGAKTRTSDLVPPGIVIKEFRAGTLTNQFWSLPTKAREIE